MLLAPPRSDQSEPPSSQRCVLAGSGPSLLLWGLSSISSSFEDSPAVSSESDLEIDDLDLADLEAAAALYWRDFPWEGPLQLLIEMHHRYLFAVAGVSAGTGVGVGAGLVQRIEAAARYPQTHLDPEPIEAKGEKRKSRVG